MLWRKFTGEKIELPIKEAVRQAIIVESLKKTKLKVCIGTDSHDYPFLCKLLILFFLATPQ